MVFPPPKNFPNRGPVPDETKVFSGHSGNGLSHPLKGLHSGQDSGFNGTGHSSFVDLGYFLCGHLTGGFCHRYGTWSEAMFIIPQGGKTHGEDNGRELLPPMPWQFIGKMTDDDLAAIYAYLKSLPAISNKVPAPVPPNMVGK